MMEEVDGLTMSIALAGMLLALDDDRPEPLLLPAMTQGLPGY